MDHPKFIQPQVRQRCFHGRRQARRTAVLEFEADSPAAADDQQVEFRTLMRGPEITRLVHLGKYRQLDFAAERAAVAFSRDGLVFFDEGAPGHSGAKARVEEPAQSGQRRVKGARAALGVVRFGGVMVGSSRGRTRSPGRARSAPSVRSGSSGRSRSSARRPPR